MGNNITKSELTGVARVNRFMLIIIGVIDALMMFGYFNECREKTLTLPFTVIVEAIYLTTLVLNYLFYVKNVDKFRYVAAGGYMVVYFIAVFFARNDLTFVIAFPITIVFILYYEYKLIKIVALVFCGIDLLDCLYQVAFLHKSHSGGPINISGLLLQGASMIVFLVALVSVTRISNSNNDEKIGEIQKMSDRVSASIGDINTKLTELNDSSEFMISSMDDVNRGVSDTAKAVQNQLYQTEEIQNKIEQTQLATEQMSKNIEETLSSVQSGNKGVMELVANSDESVGISKDVVDKLGDLQDDMEEMNNITKLIESIAFQTNIMALNANVEAARAGDAGRGFAVVASEISNMADKTKEATDSIEEIIGKTSISLSELVNVVSRMTDVISKEKDKTEETSSIFGHIEESSLSVEKLMEDLLTNIENLTEANKQIITSVETISASSEEVMSLTNQALEIETNNGEKIGKVAEMVSELANM